MTSVGVVGFCAETEYNSGDCAASAKGSFEWPVGQRHTATHLGEHDREVGGMIDCMHKCLDCKRCNFVSFSRRERDCSWYASCNLDKISDSFNTGHHSRRVRLNGSVTAEALAFLGKPPPKPAGTTNAKARLVDVVTYGGPHYDQLLELRLVELTDLVDIFLVLEHARPAHPTMTAAARGFDISQRRFAPFASRIRHVRLFSSTAGGPMPASCMLEGGEQAAECMEVDEFLDVDVQSFGSRERVVNSWQVGYAAVAQPSDLVLIGDIDEVPRRAALAALLARNDVLARLNDAHAYVLEGPTMYYHPQCRANHREGDFQEAWRWGPRLLHGESLLHFGGGTVRYYANEGDARVPTVGVPNASWHLRYFMSAAAMHRAMCYHSQPHDMVDAAEWWNEHNRPNATALCERPSLIHHAISHCADLWGRAANDLGHPRQYVPSAAEIAEMPHHMMQTPQLYRTEEINRLHELGPRRWR